MNFHKYKRSMILCWLFVMLLSFSCTRQLRLPDDYFYAPPEDSKEVLRITTIDQKRYEFRKYEILNDTLIIFNRDGLHRFSETAGVPLGNIASVNRVEIHKNRTRLLLSGIILLLSPIIILLFIVLTSGRLPLGPG